MKIRSRSLLFVVVFCSFAAGSPIAAQSHIVVGTDPTFPPMEMLHNGVLEGFDIDLMRASADEAGLSVTFLSVPWDGIFVSLQEGRVDAVVSSVSILEWRQATMDFSIPYYSCEQVVITQRGTKIIKTLNDLRGSSVGMMRGSKTARQILTKPTNGIDVRLFDDYDSQFDALMDGTLSAFIADIFGAEIWKSDYQYQEKIQVSRVPGLSEDYGIAVKKGNTALLKKINAAIGSLLETGQIARIKARWID